MPPEKTYRVMYHVGPDLDLSTKMKSGRAVIDGHRLMISGDDNLQIPLAELDKSELFRQHGTGRMIRCNWNDSLIFLTVVRLNLFGYFAIVNFVGTGQLFKEISKLSQSR